MPFLDDAAISETRDSLVLESLARLVNSSLADLEAVISHSQLEGGITDESAALFLLLVLDREDSVAAAAIRALPWVGDGIAYANHFVSQAVGIVEDETSHVVFLVRTAKGANQSFWAFLDLPWVRDGYSTSEWPIVWDIYVMATWDDEATARVVGMPFLQTLSHNEGGITSLLLDIAQRRGLQRLVASPYLEGGIRDGQLITVALVNLELQHPEARAAADRLPWVRDGIDLTEQHAVLTIVTAAVESESIFRSLLTKTWLQDGLSSDELIVVQLLSFMASTPGPATNGRIDEDMPLRILDMPFLQEITSLDVKALESLHTLFFYDEGSLQRLLSYPEFRSGITDEWTDLVAVTGLVTHRLDLMGALLDSSKSLRETRVVTLPHAGEVRLSVLEPNFRQAMSLSDSDLAALDPMDLLEHAVRASEGFMGVPFPESDVVLLVADIDPIYDGGHYGDGIISSDSRSSTYVITHETAHIWEVTPNLRTGTPVWITEGVAEFLTNVSEQTRIGTPLPQPEHTCSLADNIAEAISIETDSVKSGVDIGLIFNSGCFHTLGEVLFLELYHRLGLEAFQEGFLNLHLVSTTDVLAQYYTEKCMDNDVGLCYFRQTFLSDMTPEQMFIANEIITRRYYG